MLLALAATATDAPRRPLNARQRAAALVLQRQVDAYRQEVCEQCFPLPKLLVLVM